MRVLLIEYEVRLSVNVSMALREGPGYAVDCAADGVGGVDLAAAGCYDLIILDLMLPVLDGLGVLKKIRARGDRTPVLILTALADKHSTINLLNAGADDYLSKPFDLGELIARTKALVRRGKGAAHPMLTVSDVEVNTLEQTVRRSGQEIELSPMEYRILAYLLYRPRAVVPTHASLEHTHPHTAY